MLLKIRELKHNQQSGKFEFQRSVDLSEIKLRGFCPFSKPAEVEGTILKLPEGYKLDYNVAYTSALPCARCLTQVERGFSSKFSHILREAQEDSFDEEYVPISKDSFDLTQVVGGDLLLEMESSSLCSPDCKGLCPFCGKDKNKTSCDCKQPEFKDPRFAALHALLGK